MTFDSSLFINRELSWLEFNARVLHEAFDNRNKLLERLKFISIFSTNLDEFYMVRVAGIRRQIAAAMQASSPDEMTPQQQLDEIHTRVAELIRLERNCLHEELFPALAEHGVRLLTMDELSPEQWQTVDEFFESQIFPVLTPLAVDPSHPFPYISNLSLSLAVRLRNPETGIEEFARVKVPKSIPRWVPTGVPNNFIPLERVIAANLSALFPGMEIAGSNVFRVTRYSDLELSHAEEPEDLMALIEEQVFQRRFAEVVRVEIETGTPPELQVLLLDELREDQAADLPSLPDIELVETGPLLELGDLMSLANLDIPPLRDAPFFPVVPRELKDTSRSIFDVIKERDILVHHPFDSFAASVEQFITAAALDDNVLAIKMTLYRTTGDTAIVRALTEAAERGKQVVVLIELQARFDEANNITFARTLESFGVHVAYGLAGLKTHTKTTLVVRREGDGIRRYAHVGSGNYNSKTARLYTDIGLFTCSPSIGADLSDLFNALTGFSRQRLYRKLLVAPGDMRLRFRELIDRETEHAREGKGGRIIAKMNALVDGDTIEALYQASQAGVEIDLIVRGICCLRPGVKGVSDRIRVISIIGRFLEHSRIFYFGNAGQEEFYFGSADWMPRNFDRRVEAVAPVDDKSLHPRLHSLLETLLRDNRQAWELNSDGSYAQRVPRSGEESRATHEILLHNSWGMTTAEESVSHQTGAISPEGAATI
ncbi:MAG TPA: polyphosphate kinase 1 [Gemmatimonadaceae bacterium]|nr:polyphosphate kinase 1 [Gemmatimonadaceae bacterium]